MTSKLSVILPTYNRGEKLLRTLQSFLEQTLDYDLWEVIVVNNNSTDNTASLLDGFIVEHTGQPMPSVKIVIETSQGLSYARNRGIAEAIGDIFVFIDDDELINTQCLEEYYNFFRDHSEIGMAGGRIVAHFEVERPKWLTKYSEQTIAGVMDDGDKIKEFPKGVLPNGGNMAFRRSVADRFGIYDVTLGRTGGSLLGGEDRDLVKRFIKGGERVYYLPNAIVYHWVPASRWTLDYFFRVSYMIGVSERRRTKSGGRGEFLKRCAMELYKWCGVMVLFVGYTLCMAPSKGASLIMMRYNITKGLLGR